MWRGSDSGWSKTRSFRATKRWVVVAPPGNSETGLLLARADSPEQRAAIGNQAGGRVFLFLKTDDFDRDFARLQKGRH